MYLNYLRYPFAETATFLAITERCDTFLQDSACYLRARSCFSDSQSTLWSLWYLSTQYISPQVIPCVCFHLHLAHCHCSCSGECVLFHPAHDLVHFICCFTYYNQRTRVAKAARTSFLMNGIRFASSRFS